MGHANFDPSHPIGAYNAVETALRGAASALRHVDPMGETDVACLFGLTPEDAQDRLIDQSPQKEITERLRKAWPDGGDDDVYWVIWGVEPE